MCRCAASNVPECAPGTRWCGPVWTACASVWARVCGRCAPARPGMRRMRTGVGRVRPGVNRAGNITGPNRPAPGRRLPEGVPARAPCPAPAPAFRPAPERTGTAPPPVRPVPLPVRGPASRLHSRRHAHGRTNGGCPACAWPGGATARHAARRMPRTHGHSGHEIRCAPEAPAFCKGAPPGPALCRLVWAVLGSAGAGPSGRRACMRPDQVRTSPAPGFRTRSRHARRRAPRRVSTLGPAGPRPGPMRGWPAGASPGPPLARCLARHACGRGITGRGAVCGRCRGSTGRAGRACDPRPASTNAYTGTRPTCRMHQAPDSSPASTKGHTRHPPQAPNAHPAHNSPHARTKRTGPGHTTCAPCEHQAQRPGMRPVA
ncbi:hypothetical protein HNP84_005484 [Thermocatellispora tengchongensis]|uniref:Uncharacterized protein n=1 Tax=Thermocatellispora tengchongensis TaxID=1073253 RepID=A0A840PE64_9ACTN|nr:hypothetical protein [Thermocatellispora tengchongensis]